MFKHNIQKMDEDHAYNFLLKKMKQDETQKLFYGNPQEAGIVLKPLRIMLYPDKLPLTCKQYETVILFYAYVWTGAHVLQKHKTRKKEYICAGMRDAFKQFTSYTVNHATDVCLNYIFKKEPSLNQTLFKYP